MVELHYHCTKCKIIVSEVDYGRDYPLTPSAAYFNLEAIGLCEDCLEEAEAQ